MKFNKYRSMLGIALVLLALELTACGSGGGAKAPVAPTPALSYGIKQLQFSWPAVAGADYYRLYENTDGASGFAQVGGDITATSVNHDIALYRRINAQYLISACNSVGCSDSTPLSLAANLLPAIGYVKASNTDSNDTFGIIALSGDGNTLAVAAIGEDSNGIGLDIQADNTSTDSGAVYVFTRGTLGWSQQAYIKPQHIAAADFFGSSLALSDDGDTLAVGVTGDDGAVPESGAAIIFVRDTGGTWSQQAYIKASDPGASDSFGNAVALSGDGNTLAVGAQWESDSATTIDAAPFSGAVYVFTRTASNWSEQARIKAPNIDQSDLFGGAVALSADGNTLAVGAVGEDSSTNTNLNDNTMLNPGAVYVYTRSGGIWSPFSYIKASNVGNDDLFGTAVALSGDGKTLAVGARNEDSTSALDQTDNAASNAGAVYLYTLNNLGTAWLQQAYIKASNAGPDDSFGSSVALSHNGNTLVVGAPGEGSNAVGVEGDQGNDVLPFSGAVYLFTRSSDVWSQQAYIKASNTGADDAFGADSPGLSDDGNTLAVGAANEDGIDTGIGGDASSNSAVHAGAVYLY